MKPIELPIYFNPDDGLDRAQLGLPEIDIEDCDIRKCLLINIDALSPYISDRDKLNMTKVFSSETCFITPIPYGTMCELMEKIIGEDILTIDYEK